MGAIAGKRKGSATAGLTILPCGCMLIAEKVQAAAAAAGKRRGEV